MQVHALKEMVWAWLFGQGKTYQSRVINGQTISSGMTRDDFDTIINSLVSPITERVVIAYDWDFVFSSESLTTTADESEYVLRGTNNDCRDIINIRYGTGRGEVIERLNYLEADRREGGDESTGADPDSSDVYGYVLHGRSDDGFPKIKLYDTPVRSNTLTYRYRKSGLSIADFPSEFDFVFRDFMIGQFEPSYFGLAERALDELKARYKIGGDEYETVRMHPTIEAGNIRRNDNMGGC